MSNDATTASSETGHRCLACGRKLTVTTAPYGPACARKIRQAAARVTAGCTAAQRDDAAELIADGGIVPVRETAKNGTLYQTVSSGGTEVHLTTVNGCNCTAGLRGRHCYHVLAARILRAANRRPATAKRNDYVKAA